MKEVRRRHLGDVGHLGRRLAGFPRRAPPVIGERVGCDADQPGREGHPPPFEPRQARERLLEHRGRDVLGFGTVAGLLALYLPFHMYRQLKGTYSLCRWGALWRTATLLLFAAVALALFILAIVALGVNG